MPWSTPNSSRSRASLSSLPAVASTVAPARFASCTHASPTPLAPACTSTRCPFCRAPNSNMQSCAVPQATGTHAASSIFTPSGTTHVAIAGTDARSACEPFPISAITRCPTRRSVTCAPTSRITPAQL